MRYPPLHLLLFRVRNRHFLVSDVVIFLLTPALALIIRTDAATSFFQYQTSLIVMTLTFLALKLSIFYITGLYHLYWRHASVNELAQITLVALAVLIAQLLLFFAVLRPLGWIAPDFPRSLPLIEMLLAMPAVASTRFSIRLMERNARRRHGTSAGKRVVVVGAGKAGVMIVNEMQINPQLGLYPVAFVDDDSQKQGSKIRGISVLGSCRQIPEVVQATRADQVIIAMPKTAGKVVREIVDVCEQVNIHPKIIPGIGDVLNGKVSVSQLRKVQIEDLLRREPVRTDSTAVNELIRGKRVLITGGGGSIGSELCRQIVACRPSQLVILGRGENSVFEIHNELCRLLASKPRGETKDTATTGCQLTPVIADVRSTERIRAIFEEHRPEIVFHAAAHKHVPLMELHPAEAITNNVLGTQNLLKAALAVGVERFVLVSTDKAVNPTSVMGVSKRIAELLVHQAARASGKAYVAVRFGNVLGSRGSVVLTFRQQIAAGGPVTITHPDIQRYFMTIPEAVQLVLQAGVIGHGGEVFVLDMGDQIKIVDLARDMIELSGLELGKDIDIMFTGLRPGEKLFEELFVPGEVYQHTGHEKIFIGENASKLIPSGLDWLIAELAMAAERNDRAMMLRGLQAIVPEFRPSQEHRAKEGQVGEPLVEVQPTKQRKGMAMQERQGLQVNALGTA